MDKAQLKVSSIIDWKAARQFPETYPGDCPPQSYFVLNNKIYFLRFENPLELWFEDEARDVIKVDDILEAHRLPLVRDRYTVLAYGANRNPATLHIKFQNYNYRCPGNALAVPVLHGEIYGADYNHALALDPRYAEVYANRGMPHLRLGWRAEADADFARRIALKPDMRSSLEQRVNQLQAQLQIQKRSILR